MMSEQPVVPVTAEASGSGRRGTASLVVGIILSFFALVSLGAGGWALWKDRVDRDSSGFVSIGTTNLRTDTYAIVGALHGDGPSWLWESGVLGDSRVRATSEVQQPLFIGVARTSELLSYLDGVGYATIHRFEVTADTTHAGGPPSGPPSQQSIWATSTQGAGQQTLRWNSRHGDWSIVFMNADAAGGVAVHGNASAKLPILPWLAGGFLVVGAALGFSGGRLLLRWERAQRRTAPDTDDSPPTPTAPVVAPSREEINV